MAKARMLHKSISYSIEVSNLTLPAQLLFTWMIAHADDDGRLKGDPKYIKGMIVPLMNWSIKKIRNYIEFMRNEGLIYYWEENNEWYIEFIKWTSFQSIQKDRYKPSALPSYSDKTGKQMSPSRIQIDNEIEPQSNIEQYSKTEINKGESNEIIVSESFKGDGEFVDPKTFEPNSESEVAALAVHRKLEPNNKRAFTTTYLWAALQGLPANLFYQYCSEIQQSKTVRNSGAVFRTKALEYIEKRLAEKLDSKRGIAIRNK